jgi:hypothetical protein
LPAGNTRISLEELLRRSRSGESQLHFTLDLERSMVASNSLPVLLNLDGARSQLDVPMDGQAMRFRHRINLGPRTGSGWGSFEIPADANRRDNTAYFVYGGETPLRAGIVSEPSATARLFQFAAAATTANGIAPAEISVPTEVATADWKGHTLLVWNAPLPAPDAADKLRRFAEEGGAIIFFPTGQPDAQRFLGMGWGEVQNAETDKPFRIVRWDEEQGPLARTDEGFSLPLAATGFSRRQALTGHKSVLAAFDDGAPFLVRQTIGRGEIYFCTSLPEDQWSTLAEGPVLVPMLQRLMQNGSRRLQQVASIATGELTVIDQTRRWESIEEAGAKDLRIHAGVYRAGERLMAVNRPASEDDPEMLELERTQSLFGGLPLQMFAQQRQRAEGLQGEIWRLFLIGMLLFLIVESLLILPTQTRAEPVLKWGVPRSAAAAERMAVKT